MAAAAATSAAAVAARGAEAHTGSNYDVHGNV